MRESILNPSEFASVYIANLTSISTSLLNKLSLRTELFKMGKEAEAINSGIRAVLEFILIFT